MKLQRIEIQALPGIDRGFVVDGIDPGVTMITGPNASGKSSLLRALRFLLGGVQPEDPPGLVLGAEFIDPEGRRWRVRRTGSELLWLQDGRPVEAPPLPEPEALHSYLMRIEDLVLAREGKDRALAERLRRELHGGYDLDALRREPFRVGERKGHAERKALREAMRERRAIETRYQGLARDETELPRLDAEIEGSRAAPVRLQALDQALERLALADRLDALAAQLGGFPEGMDRLHGDEPERLARIDLRIDELQRQHAAHQALIERAQAELDRTGLAHARPTSGQLERLADRLTQLQRLDDAGRRLASDRAAVLATRDRSLSAIGGSPATRPRLDPGSIDRAERLARTLHARLLRRDELVATLRDAEEKPSPELLRRLQRGRDALETWLAEPDRAAGPNWIAALLALLGGAAALVDFVLPVLRPDWPRTPDWLPAAGGALALLAGTLLGLRIGPSARRHARRAYLGLELTAPDIWRRDAVVETRRQLEMQLIELEQARLGAEQAERTSAALESLEQDIAALEQQREALADELGFDPRLGASALDRWVRLIEQYDHADRQLRELDARRATLEIERTTSARELAGALTEWSRAPDGAITVEELAGSLSELRRRWQRADEQLGLRREARERLRRDRSELDRLRDERTRLLQTSGLEAEQSDELLRRIERLPEWRALERDRQRLAIEAERLDRVLGVVPELQPLLDAGDLDALDTLRAEAARRVDRHRELIEQRARLQQQLESAGADRALELALATEAEARERLQAIRQQAVAAACAAVLADAIESDFRQRHEPELLRSARRRFTEFTHHAWDLTVRPEHGFLAIETASGREHAPSELSTATRMQLLLALRCSWAEHLERGRVRLPFVLDEALTTSDPERFAAVAGSLQQLADEQDAQVLYLSASSHEAALWQQTSGRAPTRIDLGELRGLQQRSELVAPPDSTRPELPEPDGLDPAGYARRIGVSRLDPRLDAAAQHPFWILDDRLDLLHRLLVDWRLPHVGAVQRLLDGPSAAIALPDAQDRARIRARIALLEAWIEAWRIGRGKPVDRSVLEQAEGVTSKMLEALVDLARNCGGDARALVEALDQQAVSGFRKDKLEQLSNWLQDHGHLDPRAQLSAAERRELTIVRCSGLLREDGEAAPPGNGGHGVGIDALQAAIDLLERGLIEEREDVGNEAGAQRPGQDSGPSE